MVVARRVSVAFILAGSLINGGCRTSNGASRTKDADAPTEPANAVVTDGISRPCVYDAPMAADGYTEFAPVDAAKVNRHVMTAQGQVEDPVKTVTPTAAQITATMKKISAQIDAINAIAPEGSPERRVEIYRTTGGTPEPYCLFHAAGQAIYGTVVLYRGFNDRPQQQAALASYLFNSGFNVYNAFLSQHWHVPGTNNWPKTIYTTKILEIAQKKALSPANQAKILALKPHVEAGQFTQEDIAILDSVLAPELSTTTILQAWKDPGGPEYKQIFNYNDGLPATPGETLDFFAFAKDAKDRLDDLADMPGPLFISGLSVGGAVVLAVGELDQGKRLRGIVSQAPWLRSIDDKTQLQVMVAGPLDDKIKAFGGQYPVSWPNHKVEFSPASVAANAALGAWVAKPERVKALAMLPVAFFTTEIDVSANNKATKQLFDAIDVGPLKGLHQYHQYPADHGVGHAMTDPENYPGEGAEAAQGWNQYWRTLYQEIFRFYTQGTVSTENLLSKAQDGALPAVLLGKHGAVWSRNRSAEFRVNEQRRRGLRRSKSTPGLFGLGINSLGWHPKFNYRSQRGDPRQRHAGPLKIRIWL